MVAYLASRDAECPRCKYNCRGIPRAACPECGWKLRFRKPKEPWPDRVVWGCVGLPLLAANALMWVATLGFMRPDGQAGTAIPIAVLITAGSAVAFVCVFIRNEDRAGTHTSTAVWTVLCGMGVLACGWIVLWALTV